MPDNNSQATRNFQLTTPFGQKGGEDALLLTGFSGTEGVSELFEFKIDTVSKTAGLNFDDAIGKNCTVKVWTQDQGDVRYFVGTLTDGHALDAGESTSDYAFGYHLTLRPWLWLLSKRTNSKIFHEESVPDIISDVFGPYGFPFDNKLEKSYDPIEYCVQHNETDMDFVCRLMEENGITYHYEFENDKQTLVLGDAHSAHPNAGERKYIPVADYRNRQAETMSRWVPQRRFTTGKSKLNDYNFKKPSQNLVATVESGAQFEHADIERYQHPGKYDAQGDGQKFSEIVKNSLRSEDSHYISEGDCVSLAAGALMTLSNHDDTSQNAEYMLLRASHVFAGQNFRSGAGSGSEVPYRGDYEFVRGDVQYAPPLATQKPLIAGPQTAKVVGDGEIDCDEYGRILVHFHWSDADAQSMRCRVAQVWAGANWGGMFIPRVGMEVLVQFIDGDPDRPIVIGCVYNDENKPPYPLNGKKNIAGWKSNSTEGGGGYNEFVMDDTKGSELVRAHAQFNLDSTVENNETRQVKVDRTTKIDNNETMHVGNEISIDAKTKITITCGQSTITMDPTSITIQSLTINVLANAELNTNGKATANHTSDGMLKVGAPMVMIN